MSHGRRYHKLSLAFVEVPGVPCDYRLGRNCFCCAGAIACRIIMSSTNDTARGTAWVAVQFLMMLGVLISGPAWGAMWAGWWTWLLGGMLILLGGWVGIRGSCDLGAQRTPYPRPRDEGKLVTAGVYSWLRHPLYLSVIALGFAWALCWRSTPALVLAILQMPFFDLKARREEQWLRARFPGYADYASDVKRFIPGIY